MKDQPNLTKETLATVGAQIKNLKSKQAQSKAHEAPPVFRFLYKVENFRTFSFAERIAILFGAGLVQCVGIATAHSTGDWAPHWDSRVSKHTDVQSYRDELLQNMNQILVPKEEKK